MLALILAAAVATADGPPAQATPGQPPAPTAPATSVKPNGHDPNKIVCVREDIPNTRMTRRVCRTQAEADAQERQKDRFFHNSESQGGQMTQAPSTMGTGLPGG